MCGIAGIFAYHNVAPPVDQAELLRIREAMVARGPDGAGLWISANKRVGLAHRRLAIVDLSETGAQPMATSDDRLQIVFNGEIYNYRALRQELEAKGYRFRSTSDTEVLLHLYAEYGPGMVQYLRGMYAFAIGDEKNRGLFLARDPFGIKPLYYSDDGTTIRVASQVKALLKGGGIDTTPEPAGHVGFFLWGHVPEPYTLYKGIHALPAGTTLWVDGTGRKETRQFFNISDELAKASDTPLSITREEMRERLRAALLDSVRHHLIADVPVGVFLSAGLDSTTLAALAKEVGRGDLRTVTLGFKEFQGTHNDEVPLAELVAQHYGTIHQTRWVTRGDFLSEYQHLLDAMDQPTIDGVNSYFVSKAAAEAGLKVVISGLGGDELFGGYSSFREIPRIVRAFSPFRSFPSLGKGLRYVSAPMMKHFTSPKYAGLLEYGGAYGGAYLLRRGLCMPWELPELLDGEVVRRGWEALQTLLRLEQTTQVLDNAHLKVTALETVWYMRNQLLRDADWASMAHSLETRVPLVDIALFRAVAPLLNSTSAPSKLDMAQVSAPPLPDRILQREKTGFSIPVSEWLAQDRPTRGKGLKGWAKVVHAGCGSQLKVAVIYRQRRPGGYSIEELFHTVAGELRKHVEVIEYETGSRWRALVDAWKLRKLKADIYHVTGDINYFVLLLPRGRTVLTVHDLGHWLLGLTGLKQWIYKWIWLTLPIRYAKSVTTVSEETCIRIEQCLGIRDKVTVIPNCYGAGFRKIPKLFEGGKPRILQVGTSPNKNLPRVIEALQELPCCIAIIGPLDNDLVAKLARAGIEYECHVNLTPEEVVKQYVRADLLCFASLHEGFGLPIIEAQAVGRPVITSAIAPMRDVAGDSACLVDPYNVESIRQGITAILNSQDYRKDLVEKGYRNAARYSPASVARRYLLLYRASMLENQHEIGLK